MSDSETKARFNREVMPHLDSAYNLARWLTGNDADAADVMQEASMRAFRFLHSSQPGKTRGWLLQIVRNTAYTWLRKNRNFTELTEAESVASAAPDIVEVLGAEVESRLVRGAIEELPTEFREVLILRELDELSYSEIATIAEIPEGTVMSRLSRARKMLKDKLTVSRRSKHELR